MCVFGLSAQSAINVISVTGASNVDLTKNPVIVFGGTAGDDCSADAASTFETCNSCASLTQLKDCNTTRIYPSLRLRVSFQSDSLAGTAYLQNKDGTAVTLTPTPTSRARGETHVIEIPWNDVCTAAKGASSSCEDEADGITGTIFIGVKSSTDTTEDEAQLSIKVHEPDPTGTNGFDTINACDAATVTAGGICDFTAYPGDNKIYITALGKSSGFPTSGNIQIRALRFFVGSETDPGGFVSNPNEGFTQDLEVSTDSAGNPETTSRVIDNASNGVLHFLRVATVDQANNVARFTSDAAIVDECGSTATPTDGCIFTAKPDEVLGMLEEDVNCFIATVAYGSPLDSRLSILRNFRDQVLTPTSWGKALVQRYYKWGPFAAAWVEQHAWTKPLIRFLLWPVVGFAWATQHLGGVAFSLALISSAALALLIYRRRRLHA